ncbi:MAG: MFS transporter [Gordonia sp. (in: high G+C Gram-positive bacteria)]
MSTPLSRPRAGALVLSAIIVFSLSLRTAVTSMSPLLTRISRDLDFGSVVIGILGMLATLMFGLAGLVGPALGRRFGLEAAALGAVVATALGIGLRALSPNAWVLIVLSALALFGMGLGNVLIPPLVKRYFGVRIAAVSTAYIVCVQMGTMVPAALAVPVADAHGWRISLAMWAIIPIVALPLWTAVALRRRADVSDGDAEPTPPRLPVWRSPIAWGLTLMFGMTSLMTYSLFTWLPKVLTDAGGSEALGGNAVAVFAGIGVAATVIAPWLCMRFANPFGFVVVFAACMIAGIAGLWLAPLSAPLLWALLAGLGVTQFPMALTLINLRSRSSAGSSSLSGFGQGLGYLLACLGPLLFGILHDATGGWTAPFAFLTLACGVMLVGAWAICRPRILEDDLAARDHTLA